ncbi:nuclease [Salmonella phage 41]|nr:nuclease [Salmonella phage 41]
MDSNQLRRLWCRDKPIIIQLTKAESLKQLGILFAMVKPWNVFRSG